MCRDEEKGKKMWSKYLEREDSKIVGGYNDLKSVDLVVFQADLLNKRAIYVSN